MVGLDHSTVIQKVKNFTTKLFNQEYASGLTPEQIATNHNLDEALVWAILLEGKDDIERLEELAEKAKPGNPQFRHDDGIVKLSHLGGNIVQPPRTLSRLASSPTLLEIFTTKLFYQKGEDNGKNRLERSNNPEGKGAA